MKDEISSNEVLDMAESLTSGTNEQTATDVKPTKGKSKRGRNAKSEQGAGYEPVDETKDSTTGEDTAKRTQISVYLLPETHRFMKALSRIEGKSIGELLALEADALAKKNPNLAREVEEIESALKGLSVTR